MRTNHYVDLHLHSAASDGVHTAPELVEMAGRAGLSTISITDHDTVSALPSAGEAAVRAGIDLIPGVEISTGQANVNVHILGYFIETGTDGFEDRLAQFRASRLERASRMIERLHELGIDVSMQRVLEIAGDAAVGRPHISEAMLEVGYVASFQESFNRYIGTHAPAYVPRELLTPREAIDMIRGAGGVAVLAHPGTLHHDDWLPGLARDGLQGIEVWHPRHGRERVRKYRAMAAELNLVITGGSDFHGGVRGESTVGEQPVPAAVVDELAARAGRS